MSVEELTEEILRAAVRGIHGQARPGQAAMSQAVARALQEGVHLLVQAGTGTGKSLGYLAPALAWSQLTGERVVIATATLALQAQLASKDIPAASRAVAAVTGASPRSAVLKGRSNHVCLLRVRQGGGPGSTTDQGSLLAAEDLAEAGRGADQASALGLQVLALREWAESELEEHGLADRDDAPSHTPRAWAQVSVPARECLGAVACPFGAQCFVEAAREHARQAGIVITNHALLAVDAMHGGGTIPEHGAVIIDEAHELTSRVTGAATVELTPEQVERLARRSMPWLADDLAVEFLESADALAAALQSGPPGRIEQPDHPVLLGVGVIRAVARRVASALAEGGTESMDADRSQTGAAVRELLEICTRAADLADSDVVWVSENDRTGRQLTVAPLSVAGLLRSLVLDQCTTILTSATLTVGGQFETMARAVGLSASDRLTAEQAPPVTEVTDEPTDQPGEQAGEQPASSAWWRGMDAGSPFDYQRQGIVYVARRLPPPGREGISAETLAEVAELVWAADGGALGLFASQRSAEAAAMHVRRELPGLPVLCQGEAHLAELTTRFAADARTSLFGTLSLWQGIDIPGETCQLVIIDKIPFPRPDDPLMQARQQAVMQAGGNGFMAIAASHAALLLAQGSGRLIRRAEDRGVVAILDPRLVTARYGSFLRASMPDFWMTTDREQAISALQRLARTRSTE